MNWITLWKAVQTLGSVTHAYRKQIITLCAPEDNWGWPEAFSSRRRAGEAGLVRALGGTPGGRGPWLQSGGARGRCHFRLFSKMVNNLSEFKLTVATGVPLQEIKIPSSNDGNCRCRQEVIDRSGYRK